MCNRVLGGEHPNTSVSAFNLCCTLLKSSNHKAAHQVFYANLEWLLKRDPTTLGAGQRSIRGQLENYAKSKKGITSKHSRGKQWKRKKK